MSALWMMTRRKPAPTGSVLSDVTTEPGSMSAVGSISSRLNAAKDSSSLAFILFTAFLLFSSSAPTTR